MSSPTQLKALFIQPPTVLKAPENQSPIFWKMLRPSFFPPDLGWACGAGGWAAVSPPPDFYAPACAPSSGGIVAFDSAFGTAALAVNGATGRGTAPISR